MTKRIALIPGDGIGIEVTTEATKVLETLIQAQNLPFELVTFDWGAEKYLRALLEPSLRKESRSLAFAVVASV